MKKSTIILGVHFAKLVAFNLWKHWHWDLPNAIGIETSTACNRRCHYCPQSKEPHKQQLIEPRVFDKFINRLRELRWHGVVATTKYNEPSLHPDSAEFVRRIRLAECMPMVFTNGDRPEAIQKWVEAGAFRIRVTEHPPFKPGWAEALAPLAKRYPNVVKVERLKWIHNQAGKVSGEKIDHCFSAHGLSVNIDGTVSMCCVDYDSKYLIEDESKNQMDIFQNSLREIWDSPWHRNIRCKVIRGIPATELCKNCLK